ncbi:Hypothetical protein R9X50_00346200 [Acrodontium crateriforme]|uniref:SP-RING-type domain-containing protein n=1 Tax=Acrodontium crateriforme TaxID=150365 RepID=A0AAQ3M929_9PEZI|nr:Hypothetical protein R9X50_00346200 [Acrodontium crateriforme]
MIRPSQQGLLSPTPSEENKSTSPLMSNKATPNTVVIPSTGDTPHRLASKFIIYVPRQQDARPVSSINSMPTTILDQTHSTNNRRSLSSGQVAHSMLAPKPPPPHGSSMSSVPNPPAESLNQVPLQDASGLPLTQHHHRLPSQNCSTAPSPQSFQKPPSPPANRPLLSIPYSRDSLYKRTIDEIEPYLEKFSKPNKRMTLETGRIGLIREAISQDDYFCLVLCQLFCLRSFQPSSLPAAMMRVPEKAYKLLNTLLCPNSKLDKHISRWLTEFPQPIMQVYSSEVPERTKVYREAVERVVKFLVHLPLRYDTVVHGSNRGGVPPLVEEMSDKLYLDSPVLQATIFRAMARLKIEPLENSGHSANELVVAALVKMHQMNSIAFRQGHRHSNPTMAYQAIHIVMCEGQKYIQNCREQLRLQAFLSPSQQQPLPDFCPSHEPSNAFLLPGKSAPMIAVAHQRPNPYQQTQLTQPAMVESQPITNKPKTVSTTPQQSLFLRPSDKPRAQPLNPDSIRSALHQAHLRSPILRVKQMGGSMEPLYRFINGFVVRPTLTNQGLPMQTLTFNVPLGRIVTIPKALPLFVKGERQTLVMDEDNFTFRLRCVKLPSKGLPEESSWLTSDTVWPLHMMFDLNGQALEPRRKLHFGKNLPIDVTPFLKEGQNSLLVSVNRTSLDTDHSNFALAIEVVVASRHSTFLRNLPLTTADDSLKAICKSLNPPTSAATDDVDIAVTSSTLTINLLDPITTASVPTIPVRSTTCLHKDCFDLETFLATRPRCDDDKKAPTTVDCWRCPICSGDARPHLLRQDGFLKAVRFNLQKMGLLGETKAIVVLPDGSWCVKKEERTGVRSSNLEREESEMEGTKTKIIHVVELD